MAKVLACNCGDCTHWEIIGATPEAGIVRRVLEAVKPSLGHLHVIKCKTCGATFPATVVIDAHVKLLEVEREA